MGQRDLAGASFDEVTKLGGTFASADGALFPGGQRVLKPFMKFLQLPQFLSGFRQSGFGDGNDTAASLTALSAQAEDALDFVERESKRLRLLNEDQSFQRRLVINSVSR